MKTWKAYYLIHTITKLNKYETLLESGRKDEAAYFCLHYISSEKTNRDALNHIRFWKRVYRQSRSAKRTRSISTNAVVDNVRMEEINERVSDKNKYARQNGR